MLARETDPVAAHRLAEAVAGLAVTAEERAVAVAGLDLTTPTGPVAGPAPPQPGWLSCGTTCQPPKTILITGWSSIALGATPSWP